MALVSLREFARMQGWNPGYAHRLKEQGRLVTEIENDKEMIDVEASLERLAQTADPSKAHMQQVNAEQRARHRGEPPPPPGASAAPSSNSTFSRARTAREVWEAKTAELDYRKAAGELVKRDVMEAEFSAKVVLMREHLLALASRLTPLLASETDPRKIRALLDQEHRAALAHVADAPTGGAAAA